MITLHNIQTNVYFVIIIKVMHPHRCYSINVCTCIPFTIINSLLNISSASVVIIADSEGTPKEQTKKHGPHKHNPVYRIQRILTICNLPGHELQHLVQQHDRYRELHHHNPLFAGQWRHLEHGLGGRDRERETSTKKECQCQFNITPNPKPHHDSINLPTRPPRGG